MGLVAAKCTGCGANIEVDVTKDAGICKYCGTAFVTEKAITNYNTYVTNNNNFAGAHVTIQGDSENIEKLIERAVTFEKLDEFDKALEVYEEITSKYPMDYRGWMGIITSETQNYSDISFSDYSYMEMVECFEKAVKVASSEVQEDILKQKQKYEELYRKEKDRHENGVYCASICNMYDYRDVEKVLGCKCLPSSECAEYFFSSFTFVLGNYVECSVSYKGAWHKEGESHYTSVKATCEKYVDRTNIQELLSGCKKKSEKSGGCYIATCIYGSYDCPQVWTLRRFRDNILADTWYGRAFIHAYYAVSPVLVKWFGKTKWFRSFWKCRLDKMVSDLNNKGVDNTYYHDKY